MKKKKEEPTPDDTLKAKWAAITDPQEAINALYEHWEFVGTDPYYRDLNDALYAMVERCTK